MKNLLKENEEVKLGHLIFTITRLLGSRTDRSMEKIGLFRGQAILLIILAEQEGQTHSEIAQKLEISPAAATKVIKRMEALNYLERRADASDERVSRVYLKEDGWALIQQIRAVFARNEEDLRANLSSEDQEMLVRLLNQIYTNLQTAPGDPD